MVIIVGSYKLLPKDLYFKAGKTDVKCPSFSGHEILLP